MLSDKRWYRKVAILLSSGIIFLLGACGDVVTEEELASEEGKGDTNGGTRTVTYRNADPNVSTAVAPQRIFVVDKGNVSAVRAVVNGTFNFNGSESYAATKSFPMYAELSHGGRVVARGSGMAYAEGCTLSKNRWNYTHYSVGNCLHRGQVVMGANLSNVFSRGDWEVTLYWQADSWSSRRGVALNNWNMSLDFRPVEEFLFEQGNRVNSLMRIVDTESRSTDITIPADYSAPVLGEVTVKVKLRHGCLKDLTLVLKHGGKEVVLAGPENMTRAQEQNLDTEYRIMDFDGEVMGGKWTLEIRDGERGYDGDLLYWGIEIAIDRQ